MDGELKAKHSNKCNNIRKRRYMKIVIGSCLCVGAIMLMLATPIKAKFMARLNLLLTEIEGYTITNENQIPEVEHFKLSAIKIAIEDNDRDMSNQYKDVIQRRRDVYKGSLQLINGSHAYLFREMDQLVNVKSNKNKSYKLIETNMMLNKDMVHALNSMMKDFEEATGKYDMIMTSGYRNLADQGEVLQEKINLLGEKDALDWAMLPGYSEHHSGYAVDMSIYTDEGIYVKYKGQGDYGWINKNCYKYGLIRRYTEDKQDITGVLDEQWHYRYIGVPHAAIVTAKNFCLEEYVNYLKQFTFAKTHLVVDCSAGKYEIYYVPLEGKETSVPIPTDKAYTISGNNQDGFIVTVKL